MAERKKLTMYYPSDFDPKLVPKQKRDPNFVCEVRMMLPFNVQCNKCGEFMYMGKKFNSKKENAEGEKYKGIQVIRFYIKCGTCSNMMTFKTDPERGDYAMESGGTRTFEMWQEKNAIEAQNQEERQLDDKEDAMTTLENRTRDTQKMVDMLDALDELKAVSQRNQRIDADTIMKAADERRKVGEDQLDEEEEALLKGIKFGGSVKRAARLDDDEDDEEDDDQSDENEPVPVKQIDVMKVAAESRAKELQVKADNQSMPVVVKVRKIPKSASTGGTAKKQKVKDPQVQPETTKKQVEDKSDSDGGSGLAGLVNYGSSGDSD